MIVVQCDRCKKIDKSFPRFPLPREAVSGTTIMSLSGSTEIYGTEVRACHFCPECTAKLSAMLAEFWKVDGGNKE